MTLLHTPQTQTRISVIGAGRVGQTLAHLLGRQSDLEITQVVCRTQERAKGAVAFIGSGMPVFEWDDLQPSDVWIIATPDSAIEPTAQRLATIAQAQGWRPSTAFHCSGFCSSEQLGALSKLGWSTASVHPALNFANPTEAVNQFIGTLCGIEGHQHASRWLEQAMNGIGGKVFALDASTKMLYHAAAVFCSNFTIVLQDIAQQAWRMAGVPDEIRHPLQAQLLQASARNAMALGPAKAITGPAARGDRAVVQRQMDEIARWSPEAATIYQMLSDAAYRLASAGDALARDIDPITDCPPR